MTSRVVIKESGDTPFLPGELISLSLIIQNMNFTTNKYGI